MADKREQDKGGHGAGLSKADIEQLSRRVKMLDDRLDNLDSIVTTLVQRVMEKPLTIELTCPKCSQQIEVNITSSTRMRGGF